MDDDVFNEVSDAVQQAIMQYVDQRHARTGEDRRVLCAVAGKAMVILGCSFVGNAIGSDDPEPSLQIGKETLAKFDALARQLHANRW